MTEKKFVPLSNNSSMDEKNKEAGYFPETAEENYEFNTKSSIPEDMVIGFIDDNPKNIKFANLKLVPKGDKEIKDAKKADKAKKELEKQAKEKAKKEEQKTKK